MRVVDFDGTVYRGESLFDFYLFTARRYPKVLAVMPPVLRNAIDYKLNRASLDHLEIAIAKVGRRYLNALDAIPDTDVRGLVEEYWDRNIHRMKAWYTPRPDDVVLTASFDVIVEEACRRLGVRTCIASEIDTRTNELTWLNFGDNKRIRLRQVLGPNTQVDEFYTDALYDQPMIDMAKRAYLVRGERVKRIK
ncbi:haloacid dehalogenase-like hydrolase [Bifidobacterium avesanii]|uniref:HAD family hydrolase n=1 Tax=Bifidobacterium avesanii TaxID=1798157 RepID=A0A7K3TH93_9BIFI|nr:haloacid dehalogenase-like hydrolase [Bifidobacterium avesanii]KAB8292863.1 haloacid dehalogenase [Bifidobacterium avesanii]NEG78467.1 HAD family hydrolase [Bifidobacterium avesanii]